MFLYNDGGREQAGVSDKRDCVVRAIAIATKQEYKEVRRALNAQKRELGFEDYRYKKVWQKYLTIRGWKWHACMGIGTGCKTHLIADELPAGTIICRLSRHLVTVIDGVVNDVYDCSRNGTRCIYGYYSK